jgi:hypothetical protein
VVHIYQACIAEDNQENISHRRGKKINTNMRGQERKKFKKENIKHDQLSKQVKPEENGKNKE